MDMCINIDKHFVYLLFGFIFTLVILVFIAENRK